MEKSVLSVNNVSVFFDNHCALEDVVLKVEQFDYIGMIGPNGGGKTTLIKVILGEIPIEHGTIDLGRGVRFGYVPQFSTYNKSFPMTVFETILSARISVPLRPFHKYSAEDKNIVNEMLDKLHITKFRDKQLKELSGGQQQKVFIARAIINKPDVLLLDEPTSGLDVDTTHEIYNLLGELNKEMAIIIVSHDFGMINYNMKKIACVNKRVHIHANTEGLDLVHLTSLYSGG